MYTDEFYSRFRIDEGLAEKAGCNPYYRILQSGLDDIITIDGEKIINLASNNYLGLAKDPEVIEAAKAAVDRYGASLCGTPIATGYIELYKRVVERLSGFIGLEDSIVLPSCYQANNGLFCAVAGKEDIIFVDRFAHSSIVQGIKGAGCKIRPFLHNNMEHLGEILKSCSGYRQAFVVTESVFSTDGSIAPLKEITELCRQYSAIPVVDDSHGIGVIGKRGRGILEEQGIAGYEGIYTASLGKALANSGGVISGKKELINYLRYYCSHLVYSTALPPACLGGLEKVLDIVETKYEAIRDRMWGYKDLISMELLNSGFNVCRGKAPINSILTGSAESTLSLAGRFFENRIFSTPFIEPSVPVREGKVRLIAGANLSEDTIEEVLKTIKRMGKKQ